MGYEEVETYGFDPAGLGYYGLPAKEFADRLRARKITLPVVITISTSSRPPASTT